MMKNSNKAVNRVQRAVNIKLIKFFKSLPMIELTDNTKSHLLWLAGSLQWEPDGNYSWQFPGTQTITCILINHKQTAS